MSKRRMIFILMFLFFFIVKVNVVLATHENDHRFKIHGTVLDEKGKPVKDSKVQIVVPRIDEGVTIFTDSSGHYETILHMHDSNLGDEIMVSALGITKKVTANFVPGDTGTERGVEVNFGSASSSSPGSGSNEEGYDSYMVYGAAGVILLGGIIYIISKNSRKRDDQNKQTKG